MPRDQALRQGAVAILAFNLLGREEAFSFLNTNHPGLGGQPLTIATLSVSGRASVEAEIRRVASERRPDVAVSG